MHRNQTIEHINAIKAQARKDATKSVFHSYEYIGAVNTIEQGIYEKAYDVEYAKLLDGEMNEIMAVEPFEGNPYE